MNTNPIGEVAKVPSVARDSLMALWLLHRGETRAIGAIVAEAREGSLPGVEPLPNGLGFRVVDEAKALAAMRGHQ